MLLLGALLCPSITKGQAYQLSKISGTRDNKEEIYTYYYSDRLLDSITTQQGGAWMLKEIPEYDASKRLVKLDEWQFSNYKKQWYLANHYDYKYNAQGLLTGYSKSCLLYTSPQLPAGDGAATDQPVQRYRWS